MSVDPVSLAIEVALVATQSLLQASQKIEGPRVNTSPVTSADYGTPLNYFRGTRLLTCPCFFAKPIREERKKRKGKSGTQVSYTGFGSWAIHVADHAMGGVLQVWFDNHLVYDATGDSTKVYPLADDYELTASMRVYTGTEAQDPDPDMEAYIEARDGAGTCPAYRGTSYVYFQDVPLEQLGNRYPDVKILAYQHSALTEAEDSEIGFVGQQQVSRTGTDSGAIAFALSDGSDAAPAAGDLVVIVVSSSRYPLSSNSYHAAIDGYAPLTAGFGDESILVDFTWQAYYKFMGGTPDADFTPQAVLADSACNAIQVVVFRGVDPAIFASAIGQVSGMGPSSYDPADIVIGSGLFDPGDIGGTVTSSFYVFMSFALLSGASGQALPVVLGGQAPSGGGHETAGNMLEIYQFDCDSVASGARGARAYALYGREVTLGEGATLGSILLAVAELAGLEAADCDFAQATQEFIGFNWTQATGRQVCEALADLFDVDLAPHDFKLLALPRGSESLDALAHGEFALPDTAASGPLVDNGSGEQLAYTLTDKGDTDLPWRVFLAYADSTADQVPNVAMPPGQEPTAGGTAREASIDMSTLAISPADAQPLVERWLRRQRFGRWDASFALTRQRIALEPGDVYAPSFDGEPMTMRCTKLQLGADGRLAAEWVRDDPAVAVLAGSAGGPAAGHVPDEVPDGLDSLGAVLDLPLLVDAHDQAAPLAYVVAGPGGPGTWMGAEFAESPTGADDSFAAWDSVASGDGSAIGTCTAALPDALAWVPDLGSSVEVTLNVGELTAATLDDLLLDDTLNLAAIASGAGWEVVQFMTPTLTGTLTYTVTGFLRGCRGTEWATAGHAPGDRFILLNEARRHSFGASDLGDTDNYIVASTGAELDPADAFEVEFTGASHRPYSPVNGTCTLSGGDWSVTATRRTRIGGSALNGQDVPLGEASQSWEADVMDGSTVVRTLAGTSLPLVYEADKQVIDFGSGQTTLTVNLYQLDPTLTLRGYPLEITG